MTLSVKKIEKLKTKSGRHFDAHGLYLQVRSATNCCWLLRYERAGRQRWMGLGPLKDFNLSEARERARRARQLLADGIDPLAQKRQAETANALREARSVTFEDAANQYYAAHSARWKNDKSDAQFLSTLKAYVHPFIGQLPVADIDRAAVLQCLDPIWKTKTETARRVRARIEMVLAFAQVREWRSEAQQNPARWKDNLALVLAARGSIQKVQHHRALPFDQIAEFMTALRNRTGTAARALEFTVLTAARTSETTGAVWEEFDLDAKLWTVPAERMKGRREHRVPLTNDLITLLKTLPTEKGNPFVFVGPRKRGISNMAMDAVLRRMGMKDQATVHGMRSTFKDWSAEVSNFPPEISEAALAHVSGDKVELAYRRGDLLLKRRKLMEAWNGFTRRPKGGAVKLFPTAARVG